MELKALNKELSNRKSNYVVYLTDNTSKYIFLYYDNGFCCLLKITDSVESKIIYKNHFVKFIL